MNRKKVLFLTSRFPYPPVGGEKLKNLNLIKLLSQRYEVSLVSLSDEIINHEYLSELEKYTSNIKVFYKPKWKMLFAALKSFYNQLPLQVNYFFFKDVDNYIKQDSTKYDLVFSTLIRTASYCNTIDKPKILDMADSIGLNYMNSAKKSTSWFWRLIYSIEYPRLLKFEEKMIENFNKTLFFNYAEKEYFQNSGKTYWIPHGVNEDLLEYNKVDSKYKNSICFFGKMDYQPNVDAALWVFDHVLPKLNKNITFYIVGATPSDEIRQLESKSEQVKVTGFVEDPYIILKSSICIVAPMQTGGGIQNKVLEAMAIDKPVIVSSLCAKPIVGAKDKQHFLIMDSADEMAEYINKESEKIQKNMPQTNSQDSIQFHKDAEQLKPREFIRNNFTWTIYAKHLYSVIDNILEAK